MGRLVIHRERAFWIDRMRSYEALVDGVPSGKVANGETLEIEVARGPHRVQMKIDWCGSREVVVDGSTDTRLHCRAGANPFFVLAYLLFWRNDYIKLHRA